METMLFIKESAGRNRFTRLTGRIGRFPLIMAALLVLAGWLAPYPGLAMWFGFLVASVSTVSNDSIQTIGTFLSSNRNRPWWILWLYIAGVMVLTLTAGWLYYDGDVSFQRLSAKGFETAPSSFTFLQLAAPVFLLMLTRLRMPVSTTFLILSCFATSADGVARVLVKSLSGYGIAFGFSIVIWGLGVRWMEHRFTGPAHRFWQPAQFLSTTLLWVVWLMQDAANIAVYLPRRLDTGAFLVVTGALFAGLGLLIYMRGDRIQHIVEEKSHVQDVRSATLIDLVYGIILLFFQLVSVIPMSTTWVFLGLLGGRELALTLRRAGRRDLSGAGRIILRDMLYAGTGLLISLLLALAVNPAIRTEIFRLHGN